MGGGVGGLVAANILKEKLGERAEVKLIERKRSFQFSPSYPWLMLGSREPEQIQRNLGLLEKKGIRLLQTKVKSIDLDGQAVKTSGPEEKYDYLIIALGAEYAPEKIPGLAENAHHIYDLEATLKFKKALEDFTGGTIAIGISRIPFKCPAAPYEVALLVDYILKKRGVDRFKIHFFTPEGMPLSAAGPDIGGKAVELLKSKDITCSFKKTLKEVEPNRAHFEDGETISFDLMCCVPPHVPPKPVVEAGLIDKTGWIPVNPETLRTKREKVYAVGDVNSVQTPSGYVPYLPKAGVFAHGQAKVVAHNIATEIKGRGKKKGWDGEGSCFLETGYGQAAYVKGVWFTTPHPSIKFHSPSRIWHMQKVLFEKYWMRHWF